MFGLGGWEIALIAIFGFLIFGPDKLPGIARTIGRGIRQFRSAQDQMNKVIKSEVYDPIKDLEPLANPFAGFSLDPKKDDKTAAKGTAKPKTTSTSKTNTAINDGAISSEDMKAAITAQAAKTASSAAAKSSEKSTAKKPAAQPSETFAERRARLEKEHARAKAAKTEQDKLNSHLTNPGATKSPNASKASSSNDVRKEGEEGA